MMDQPAERCRASDARSSQDRSETSLRSAVRRPRWPFPHWNARNWHRTVVARRHRPPRPMKLRLTLQLAVMPAEHMLRGSPAHTRQDQKPELSWKESLPDIHHKNRLLL